MEETEVTAVDQVFHDAGTVLPVHEVPDRRSGGGSRRDFLRLVGGVGVGLGLGFSDLLAGPALRRADAASFDYWNGCTSFGYFNASTTCVPPSSYFGSDNCYGGTLYHFHREESTSWTSGGVLYMAVYDQYETTCDNRNAWIWNGSSGTMCSDGQKTRYRYSGSSWLLDYDNFSICKTTI